MRGIKIRNIILFFITLIIKKEGKKIRHPPSATTFFIPNNPNACKSTPIGFIKNLLIDYMSFN